MAQVKTIRASLLENRTLRRWLSRAFIVSILVYLVVIGYLIAEAVMGASKWAPYGVNIPFFIALTIASEVVIAVTAVWIFREDSGIWPSTIAEGWADLRHGRIRAGLAKVLSGAWDVSIIDLRLRTPQAIFFGRVNRVAALIPLVYVLAASAGTDAPWGLRGSALFDVVLTVVVWAFMELVMVRPEQRPTAAAAAPAASEHAPVAAAVAVMGPRRRANKQSYYEVRPVQLDDLPRVEEIERLKWREQAATPEMILARLAAYPEGQLAAIHVRTVDGKPVSRSLVAWFTGMAADERRIRSLGSWDQVTSNGTLKETNPKGDVLVGINLTSVTEGAVYMLVGGFLSTVVMLGKNKMIGVSRLNGFATFNERRKAEGKPPLTAEQYARLREVRGYRLNEAGIDLGRPPLGDHTYVDIVARLRAERGEPPLVEDEAPDYVCANVREYLSLPGSRFVDVLSDYFPDPASADYGVLMEWPNPIPVPLRHLPWVKRWVAATIQREIQAEWQRRQELLRRRRDLRRALEQIPEFLRKGGEPALQPALADASRPEREPVPPPAR